MQLVQTSGGIAYGRRSGPQLDIIPIVHFPCSSAIQVESFYLSRLRKFAYWTKCRGGDPEAVFVSRGWTVLHGIFPEFIARLSYPEDISATQALRDIEAAEQTPLSPAICFAFLAAERGLRNGVQEKSLTTAISWGVSVLEQARVVESSSNSRKHIENLAIQFLSVRNLHVVEQAVGSLGGVDLARFFLEIGRYAWNPAHLKRSFYDHIDHDLVQVEQVVEDIRNHVDDPSCKNDEDFVRFIAAATFASVDLALRKESIIEFDGSHIRCEDMNWRLAYFQMRVLAQSDRFADIFRILFPDGCLAIGDLIDMPYGDTDLLNGIATSLKNEAADNKVYVPYGSFVLDLPDQFPLKGAGVDRLIIVAEPSRLWVRFLNKSNQGLVICWDPENGVQKVMLSSVASAWIDVTMSALWLDLVTAGEVIIPEKVHRKRGQTNGMNKTVQVIRSSNCRNLPSPRRLTLSGYREWGTVEERRTISLRSHGVRGHLMRLPEGRNPSQSAHRIALEFGIVLPLRHTFVRPHIRGGKNTGKQMTDIPEAVTIRAKGLASIITLLGREPE